MRFKEFWGEANFIASSKDYHFPYLRKVFSVDEEVKNAKLLLSVLGFGEA